MWSFITAQRTVDLAKELGITRWIGAGDKVDSLELDVVPIAVEVLSQGIVIVGASDI